MPFIKGATETEGEWFIYGKEPAGGVIRFKVRRMSPGKAYEIERRHGGRKGELRFDRKAGQAVFPRDNDNQRDEIVEKASWALLDSENVFIRADEQSAATAYAEALGGEVKVGEPVKLDGKWGRKDERGWPLKELFLSDELGLCHRIVAESVALGIEVAEENEAGKDASSLT